MTHSLYREYLAALARADRMTRAGALYPLAFRKRLRILTAKLSGGKRSL